MILVCGGIKGGSGKTTLATNLTVKRSLDGHKVLLVDADEQRSASDWVEQRESLTVPTNWTTIQLSGKSIYSQIQKLKNDYDDIIIDVGGRDTTSQRSALAIANLFLIPFKPRSLDIWTIGPLKALISEIQAINPKLKCIAVINQADARGGDNHEALKILSETPDLICCTSVIGMRKSYSNAAAQGLGIFDEHHADEKAINELTELYSFIYNK